MSRFTLDTTMRAIYSDSEMQGLRKYLIFNPECEANEVDQIPDKPLRSYTEDGWSVNGVLRGLNFLANELSSGRVRQFFIYKDKDCSDDPMKKDVNLIWLRPGDAVYADKNKPNIILAAGGAYKRVSTMVESLPTAVYMVKRGYDVFLLTYRVSTDKAAIKALDDLAASIKYIFEHGAEIGVETENYAIGGFSAGANLICNFGVPGIGYRRYGLSKPTAMFSVYTYIDLKAEAEQQDGGLLKPMFGSDYGNYIEKYNTIERIDSEYPPCYIVCSKDDGGVPPRNSETMAQLLKDANVPVIFEEGDHGRHGFGDGSGTDLEGWPDRAIDFLENITALQQGEN